MFYCLTFSLALLLIRHDDRFWTFDWTDIEWKLVYVGSPDSEEYDQELDNCMVGPVPIGEYTLSSSGTEINHQAESLWIDQLG